MRVFDIVGPAARSLRLLSPSTPRASRDLNELGGGGRLVGSRKQRAVALYIAAGDRRERRREREAASTKHAMLVHPTDRTATSLWTCPTTAARQAWTSPSGPSA